MGHKTLSHSDVLEMTDCEPIEPIETNNLERQLWFAGTLFRQNETRLCKRILLGRLAR